MENFIESYFRLLTEDYVGINLTRITDFEDFKLKQIEDSIAPYSQSVPFKVILDDLSKPHIDVGFGGGFPILPLAELLPNKKFLGVETRNKKVKVVGEISNKLGQNNTNFFHSRIENILIDKECSISFKAVGKVNDFLEKVIATAPCEVYFYKGPGFYELEKDQIFLAQKNWEMFEEKEIKLKTDNIDKRYLIGFKNRKVLHGTSNKAMNNLVKLSDII